MLSTAFRKFVPCLSGIGRVNSCFAPMVDLRWPVRGEKMDGGGSSTAAGLKRPTYSWQEKAEETSETRTRFPIRGWWLRWWFQLPASYE